VVQVTVSDASSPDQFSCQLTSSRLALELMVGNMNDCYTTASRRHSRDDDDDTPTAVAAECLGLDVSVSTEPRGGGRYSGNLERPLGVHHGDVGPVVAEEEASPAADRRGRDLSLDDDDDDLMLSAEDLQPGTCCAALYSGDTSWYRARVQSADADAARVVFVDYGTESTVDVADLRRLKERFVRARAMSFACRLDGWDAAAADPELADEFRAMVLDRKLIADVRSTAADGRYSVRLLDMGLSVGDRLRNPDAYRPVAVCVTTATSPHDFWCRCVDDAAGTAELPLLMDRIADLYSAAGDHQAGTELALDDDEVLYAARYADGVWYRARVISSHQSSAPASVDVLLVDYGTKTQLASTELRALPADCRVLPPQAVHCRLAGVAPADCATAAAAAAVWDDAAMSRFAELVMCADERALRLHPVSVVYGADGEVAEMTGRLTDSDRDVGAELVDSGYAAAVDYDPRREMAAGAGAAERRRRSSCLSVERCNLFVSFDAASDIARQVVDAAAADTRDAVTGDGVAETELSAGYLTEPVALGVRGRKYSLPPE